MGWETRGPNGRTYYYRKTRTSDGRVKSTYLGAGPLACLSAEADAMCRALVAYRDASLKRFEEAVDASAAATCALTAEVKAAQAQALEEQGLHYHRGEWRRPRVQPPAGPSAPP